MGLSRVWTYHLYFSLLIILVSLYDKKIFHARIRIRRNDSKTFYLNSKEVKFSLFGGLLSHTRDKIGRQETRQKAQDKQDTNTRMRQD